MGIDEIKPDYLGLPIITPLEGEYLRARIDAERTQQLVSVQQLGQFVIGHTAAIEEIVEHDIDHFFQLQQPGSMTGEQQSLTTAGIQSGYHLFVGCVSWVRLRRQHMDDLGKAITTNNWQEVVPKIDDNLKWRVIDNLEGKQPLGNGIAQDNKLMDDSAIGDRDAEEYQRLCPQFEYTGTYFVEATTPTSFTDLVAYGRGVHLGASHAIRMYVLAYEEAVLSQYEFPSV